MDIEVIKNYEVGEDGNAIKDTRMISMRDIRRTHGLEETCYCGLQYIGYPSR